MILTPDEAEMLGYLAHNEMPGDTDPILGALPQMFGHFLVVMNLTPSGELSFTISYSISERGLKALAAYEAGEKDHYTHRLDVLDEESSRIARNLSKLKYERIPYEP